MPTIQLPEWSTSEVLAAVNNDLSAAGATFPGCLTPVIHFPGYFNHPRDRSPTWGYRTGSGEFKLTPKDIPTYTFAKAVLSTWHSHCGIITVGHVHCNLDSYKSLWVKTLESYLWYLGYSAVIAGDGSSSFNVTRKILEKHGGWSIVELGVNRRMGKNTQSLIYKQLKEEDILKVNWNDAK